MKNDYPHNRVDSETHSIIKLEARKLGMSMTAYLVTLVHGCHECPDDCSQMTGGALGTQPPWPVDEEQVKREIKDCPQLEKK